MNVGVVMGASHASHAQPAHAGWTKVVAEIGEILILWLDKDTFWLGQGEVMCPI